jgi:hypothetical protein
MSPFIRLKLLIGVVFLITACATSMSPTKVNETLPSLTRSTHLSPTQAEYALNSNICEYLVKGRSYTAPIALSVKGDLKNGAKGIDEWVELDGGNSYVLTSYNWKQVDDYGSTQLNLEFDTLLCD